VPGHPGENTYCYNCKELLMERDNFLLTKFGIKDGRCHKCKTGIDGRFA